MSFPETVALPSFSKNATWLQGALAKFADGKIARYIQRLEFFVNFSEAAALPAQDMLHTEIWMCDGNAIIS